LGRARSPRFPKLATLVVILVLFVVKAWAFVDSISRPAEAFVAADKLTKPALRSVTRN